MSRKNLVSLGVAIITAMQTGGIVNAQSSNPITLVDDRRPAATIVLTENATCSAQFAAHELQNHIKKITGAVLPIKTDTNDVEGTRILVGKSRLTTDLKLPEKPFATQEYIIRFLPNTIVLMGNDADNRTKVKYDEKNPVGYTTWPKFFEEQGTCYAVYDFLEKLCGVRWFRPGELGTVCPKTATLKVSGKDIRRSPDFKYRNPYPLLVDLNSYDKRVGLWNWAGRAKKDQPQVDRVETLAYPELKGKKVQAKCGMISLFLHRMRLGGEPYHNCHSFYGYYDRFLRKNPKRPEVFEAAHPEWFAKGYGKKPSPIRKEGEKPKKTYYEKPPQMCYTNPKFIKQVVQDARDYFDGKGKKLQAVAEGDYFSLVPMDNSLYCKCPECRKLTKPEADRGKGKFSNDQFSEYVFNFVNKVAREIKKSHPDKFIAAAAYSKYAFPPERERLESNVSICFCLHARMVYSPEIMKNDQRLLQAWSEYAKGNRFQVWLYYLFPVYSAVLGNFNCFPGFFAHGIEKIFKQYHKYGVRGAFFEGFDCDVEAYVTCKMMDDPSQNVDKLLDEYFTGMYGAAAKPMKEFYLTVEKIYSDPANYPANPKHQTVEIAWENLGNAERMKKLGKLMDQAHTTAKTDTEKTRVALFDQQIWKYMTTGRERYLLRKQTPVPSIKVPKVQTTNGDATKVDWNKAVVLKKWYNKNGKSASRKLKARLVHDNKFLYMQLIEQIDVNTLKSNAACVWNGDDWEIFFSKKRAKPYHQIGLGPDGTSQSLAHVEGKPMGPWDSGAAVVSDITTSNRWITCVAFPLNKLLPSGVNPGEKFYMNIIRVWWTGNKGNTETWTPMSGVHQLDRFGEVTLE